MEIMKQEALHQSKFAFVNELMRSNVNAHIHMYKHYLQVSMLKCTRIPTHLYSYVLAAKSITAAGSDPINICYLYVGYIHILMIYCALEYLRQ